MRKSAKERIERCIREGLCAACLQPFEEGERSIRLNHVRCYHATRRAIKAGKTTDEERIAEGKILRSQEGGRRPSNPVSIDLSE